MDNNKNFVLNIGRQLGSGGHAIGTILAKEFGIKFYDKEVLDLAAQESGFNKYFFERDDEHRGFVKSLFNSIIPFTSSGDPYGNQLSSESLFKFQSDAIKKAAERESCVFVGRCADYVLRDHPRCVNIFISANMEDRVTRLMQNLQIDAQEAEKRALEGDDKRAFIPERYIMNEYQKLDIYKRIAGIENDGDAEDMLEELLDRFGDPPKAVQNLLSVAALKALAHRIYVSEIKQQQDSLRITMYERARVNPAGIPKLLERYGSELTFKMETNPYFIYKPRKKNPRERINFLEKARSFLDEMITELEETPVVKKC